MPTSAPGAYLESAVLAADPVELVRILHRVALDSIREARTHLASGDIAARSRAISRAMAAVAELNASLDHRRGGELAARLVRLYDYAGRRLSQANAEQTEAPLAECASLLATLLEGWSAHRAPAAAGMNEAAADMLALAAVTGPACEAERVHRSWSA